MHLSTKGANRLSEFRTLSASKLAQLFTHFERADHRLGQSGSRLGRPSRFRVGDLKWALSLA